MDREEQRANRSKTKQRNKINIIKTREKQDERRKLSEQRRATTQSPEPEVIIERRTRSRTQRVIKESSSESEPEVVEKVQKPRNTPKRARRVVKPVESSSSDQESSDECVEEPAAKRQKTDNGKNECKKTSDAKLGMSEEALAHFREMERMLFK